MPNTAGAAGRAEQRASAVVGAARVAATRGVVATKAAATAGAVGAPAMVRRREAGSVKRQPTSTALRWVKEQHRSRQREQQPKEEEVASATKVVRARVWRNDVQLAVARDQRIIAVPFRRRVCRLDHLLECTR